MKSRGRPGSAREEICRVGEAEQRLLHVPKGGRRRGRTSRRIEKGLLNEGEESGRERTSGRFGGGERRRNKEVWGRRKGGAGSGWRFPSLFWLFGYFYFWGYLLQCLAKPTWGMTCMDWYGGHHQ